MSIVRFLATMVTALLFMVFGLISIFKPNIIGKECYWVKYKHFYIPKYKDTTNKHYLKQIRVVGIGLTLSSLVMFIVSIASA